MTTEWDSWVGPRCCEDHPPLSWQTGIVPHSVDTDDPPPAPLSALASALSSGVSSALAAPLGFFFFFFFGLVWCFYRDNGESRTYAWVSECVCVCVCLCVCVSVYKMCHSVGTCDSLLDFLTTDLFCHARNQMTATSLLDLSHGNPRLLKLYHLEIHLDSWEYPEITGEVGSLWSCPQMWLDCCSSVGKLGPSQSTPCPLCTRPGSKQCPQCSSLNTLPEPSTKEADENCPVFMSDLWCNDSGFGRFCVSLAGKNELFREAPGNTLEKKKT
jgi:hypothetical protein